MLDQIASYCRIVNPTPTDGYVTQRRAAVEKLVGEESPTIEGLEAFVEYALFGIPAIRDARHETATKVLITAIRESQPSFAGDVDSNQLDLRLVSALVIGERLRVKPAEQSNIYFASLIISALSLQPLPQELYLSQLLQDLINLSKGTLEGESKRMRERLPWPNKSALEITGNDPAALAKSTKNVLGNFLDVVKKNTNADREELDVLWWVFGGRSATTGEKFETIPDGERLLLAAIELSDRMQMPPISTSQNFLGSLVPNESKISLAKLVEQMQKEHLVKFIKNKAGVESILDSHPSLLPISWLANRLVESDLSPGWQAEFGKKTKLQANLQVDLGDWVRQMFAECVTQRLALPLLADNSES